MASAGKPVWRAIWIAVAAAAILYGGAQAGIRSPWFRVAVERRLSEAAGMEVRVGRIRPTESLNLRIGDISALEDRAGMEVKVLRVKWSFLASRTGSHIRKLVAEDAVLTIAPDAEGNLLPAFAGNRALELVAQWTRSWPPDGPERGIGQVVMDADGGRMHGEIGTIGHVRLLRCAFSLRDASGRERAGGKDFEIDRFVEVDDLGRSAERWEVQAAVFASEGRQLTGLDWAAGYTGESGWEISRFSADSWSDGTSPEGLGDMGADGEAFAMPRVSTAEVAGD